MASFSPCQWAFFSDDCSRSSASSRSIASRARDAGRVLLLLQRLLLDLELLDAALDPLDLLGHRVDLDPQPRRGLVHQVDGLVGQEAVGDVAVGERRRRHDGRVLDAHAVVDLVALLEPAQDGDGVLDARLAHVHRLKATLQGRVLLDVLAVLVQRRGADAAQLAARQHRLEQVAGVHGALGRAGADDRVQLVHEQDDLALGLGDLLEHCLEPVLELAAVLSARDQRADVEGDHAPVAQRFGHVAVHDPLGQAFGDRGLAHARLADQHRVVLRAPRQHLDHAPDLVVAADDGVELALLGGLGQVDAEAVQRLVAVLGVLVGHAVRSAHALHGLGQLLGRRAHIDLGVGGKCEEQVLGGHVLVAHPARGLVRLGEQLGQRRVGGGLGRRVAGDRGRVVQGPVGLAPHRLGIRTRAAQDRDDDAAVLLEQRHQQMVRTNLGVAARLGQPLRGGERLLGLHGHPVRLHWWVPRS